MLSSIDTNLLRFPTVLSRHKKQCIQVPQFLQSRSTRSIAIADISKLIIMTIALVSCKNSLSWVTAAGKIGHFVHMFHPWRKRGKKQEKKLRGSMMSRSYAQQQGLRCCHLPTVSLWGSSVHWLLGRWPAHSRWTFKEAFGLWQLLATPIS